MEFFRIKKDIPFMRHAVVFNIISLVTFLLAVFFLATKGLHFSIEFTGGTLLEVSYPQAPTLDKLRHQLEADGFTDTQVQNFGSSRDVLIRVPPAKGEQQEVNSSKVGERVMASLQKVGVGDTAANGTLQDNKPELKRVEFVGPQVGKELASDGALALLSVVIGIMAYLALRFEWRFAVSAIIANLHDVIIILGFFALFQWEFSLPVLAAVLAIIGYSINESIVIADRIRENFRSQRKGTTADIINLSVTKTLSRTIMTGMTTFLSATALFIWGGDAIHNFALAMMIGISFGTYSSVFVAAALMMYLGVSRQDFIVVAKEVDDRP